MIPPAPPPPAVILFGHFNQLLFPFSLINFRRVAWQTDVVTEVPCSPSQFTCKGGKKGFPIATNQPGGVSNWAYSEVGGTVLLTPDGMPYDENSWAQLTNVPIGKNSLPFLFSTHICSYMCYFSRYSESANGENCWLSKAPPGSSGTQCSGFPTENGYPN